jgi:hypothetical protein
MAALEASVKAAREGTSKRGPSKAPAKRKKAPAKKKAAAKKAAARAKKAS